MTQGQVVIVGAGHAGFTAAASLRRNGYAGAIALITAESCLPYQRPPLSKGYLDGLREDRLSFRPEHFYERKGIELLRAYRVEEIDRTAKAVVPASGESLRYDHLILATGSTPQAARLPGNDLDGVFRLHRRADADALRERLVTVSEVVIVGGGFIGLEFAAHARGRGKNVTIVEAADRLMARAVTPVMSEFFLREHVSAGSQVLLDTPVARLVGGDGSRVQGVELHDGSLVKADLVVVGVGVRANTGLAERAGLAVNDGVLVDRCLRTSDPDIFAIGDCASYPYRNRRTRHECVENAVGQAHAVASTLTSGESQPYRRTPVFWSDQADLKLQIVGDFSGSDRTEVIGDPAGRSFSVNCYRDGALIAVESVNRPSDHVAARKLVDRSGCSSPAQVEGS
ncbi:NAD(P)/FAD-dependent oxidoreductase [Amycolatopsis tucumanensis]|uniref:FAD-dependent oxidoreductase n=1 Tax=Amycolatopsis tucumanensis TaxID=401106 RepID=A0ABP7IUA3_9PSEU|nr:FAD-dependent oxidoreductase [Amycolatopsis tucumanensis]MCF6424141.1 FAD-dependent oxidoreductase [Amycolatopsis tucumanensis]